MARLNALLALTLAALPLGHAARAGQETPVYVFQFGTDGAYPTAGVVRDPKGNLYGTATLGGNGSFGGSYNGDGTLFKISPSSSGAPGGTFTVLHIFLNATDGAHPGNTVTRAPDGTLYGTAQVGGPGGGGTVFSLTPPATGQTGWSYKVLYSFHKGGDGESPIGKLYRTASGALYGATQFGGIKGPLGTAGVIYRLTPPASGGTTWGYRALYRFSNGSDGGEPGAGVIGDASGNLYGTTTYGGASGVAGVIFKLAPPAAGQFAWTETVIHDFSVDSAGERPEAELVSDAAGNLYGTASGSINGAGTVFEISPPPPGQVQWNYSVLFGFAAGTQSSTGGTPYAPLIADGTGGFYGTTEGGGTQGGGVVFHLTPPAAGQTIWTETVLHDFLALGTAPDGNSLFAGVTLTDGGWLVGTTQSGEGSDYFGTVYKVHP